MASNVKDPEFGNQSEFITNVDELQARVAELAIDGKQIAITKADVKGWHVAYPLGPSHQIS